jgi:hypothetical protein
MTPERETTKTPASATFRIKGRMQNPDPNLLSDAGTVPRYSAVDWSVKSAPDVKPCAKPGGVCVP